MLDRKLIRAAALAVDTSFLTLATAGVTNNASTGQTAESFRADLAALLAQVPIDATSRLFIVTTPAITKNLATMGSTSTNGAPAFEDMGPLGGSIAKIPVIASDAVSSGLVVLIDASGFAGAVEPAQLQLLREGSIFLDTNPDSPVAAGSLAQSLWQLNLVALLCERWFGAQKLRSNSVAVVSNTGDYGRGFSPP